MQDNLQAKQVSVEIEIGAAISQQILMVETFTHTPKQYYKDPKTRLFAAKIEYRKQLTHRMEDPADVAYKLRGLTLRIGGRLLDDEEQE